MGAAAVSLLLSLTSASARIAAPVVSNASLLEARPINISLTNFSFSPTALQLHAGQPILLRIANDSSISHDFTAPDFFLAADMPVADRQRIAAGKVSLKPRESVILRLIPKSGRYRIKCSHPFHKILGMSGRITVVD